MLGTWAPGVKMHRAVHLRLCAHLCVPHPSPNQVETQCPVHGAGPPNPKPRGGQLGLHRGHVPPAPWPGCLMAQASLPGFSQGHAGPPASRNVPTGAVQLVKSFRPPATSRAGCAPLRGPGGLAEDLRRTRAEPGPRAPHQGWGVAEEGRRLSALLWAFSRQQPTRRAAAPGGRPILLPCSGG